MHPTHKIQHDTYYRVLATYQTYHLLRHLLPCGPIPQKPGEGFDAPPTLERSGSEHRRAVTSSLFGQERGLVRDVESSLKGGTRWFEEFYFP